MKDSEDIREICENYGLEVRDVLRDGAFVQLIPASLASLPDAASLRRLAAEIRNDDVRYVTLVIDDDE